MRRIILFVHSTLNGVVTGDPAGDRVDFNSWTTPESIETGSKVVLETFETVDTVLQGRVTYEALAKAWPFVADWPAASGTALRLGEKINTAHKLVATRDSSYDKLAWGDFAPARRVTVEDVAELKSGDGGDILIFGSPTLVRSLADADLIDEYQLQVHPVVSDVGEPLFDTRRDFRLGSARPLEDGSLFVTYELATGGVDRGPAPSGESMSTQPRR